MDPYERSRSNQPIQDADRFVLLAGNSSPELAQAIAKHLGTTLADGKVRRFADGEVNVQFQARDVIGRDCYIVQPTQRPVNDNLMELIFMVSACRRAGARSVTVVTPYYGYARQDRRFNNQAVPVSSADVTQILEFIGVNRIITVDLHCLQAQGFCSSKVAFDDYEGAFAGISYFLDDKVIPNKRDICVISPDAGGMKRAKAFHGHFGYHGYDQVGLAMISKERKQANQVDSMVLIGDVQGKTCIIVDDMIDTAGTLVTAAKLLKDSGAAKVFAFATHGIFSGPAAERIAKSDLEKVITTDSMTVSEEFRQIAGDRYAQVSLGLLLAEVIRRTHQHEDTQDLLKIPVY